MPEILLSVLGVIGHILLSILKVVLIILLVILILILLLLFTPFAYRTDLHRHEEGFHGTAGLSWLGFVFRLRARFGNGSNDLELYLFGIPLRKLIRRIRERKNRGRSGKTAKSGGRTGGAVKSGGSGDPAVKRYAGAKKKPTVPPGGTGRDQPTVPPVGTGKGHSDRTSGQSHEKTAESGPRKQGGSDSRSKIKEVCGKIKDGIGILRSDEYRPAFEVIKQHGLKIVRHIFPRKIEGSVVFGFEDPSVTGKALGVLSWILPVIPEELRIVPDFTEEKLEADVKMRGHFFAAVLLKEGLMILLNQEVKKLIRAVRSGQSGSSEKKTEH